MGMTTTLAIMYPVETQPIWSSGVPKLARMSVSATLTMEMSSIAISAAHITATVMPTLDPVTVVGAAMARLSGPGCRR